MCLGHPLTILFSTQIVFLGAPTYQKVLIRTCLLCFGKLMMINKGNLLNYIIHTCETKINSIYLIHYFLVMLLILAHWEKFMVIACQGKEFYSR